MKKQAQFSDKHGKVVSESEGIEERESPGVSLPPVNDSKEKPKTTKKASKASKPATTSTDVVDGPAASPDGEKSR